MASLPLKANYRCSTVLQQFYTGGPFAAASDGSFLVCACYDSVKIVDASNGSVRSTIEGDSDAFTAIALSPDDKLLFSASYSHQIRVWDLSSLKCLRSWKGHEGPVKAICCDASGGLLATAGTDRKVFVWDVDGGFCTHLFKGHTAIVTCILFHPDPTRFLLFSGSDDATIRIWDLQSKKCTATLKDKHFSMVTSIAVSEDGSTLLSAGRDKVVNLWDLNDYGCKITVPTYEVLETVCVVSSGTSLASCLGSYKHKSQKEKSGLPPIFFITVGERGIVKIWNSEGAVCMYEQQYSDVTVNFDKDDTKRGFAAAVLLPSDHGLLCCTVDQHFLYYSPSISPEDNMNLGLNRRLVGNTGEISDMKFLGEGEEFFAVATNLELVQVYNLMSMSCSYVLAGHTDIVLCLDTFVSNFGRTLIVTGSKDNSVRLWEAEKNCCIGLGIGHLRDVTAVAFSKKRGNFFVSGSSDRTLKVWSLDNIFDDIEQPTTLKAKAGVAAHSDDINSVAIAPNDIFVCSGSKDRTACIWKLPDLVSVVILKGHKRAIFSVEFSPVDQCVMTASGDKTIKIWAISDGSCLKTFEGHTSSVLRASFITRGAQFISSGADGLVKLWTVRTNECIATYDQHEDKVWGLAVGNKTEIVLTGSSDGIVNLWKDSTLSDKEDAFRKEEEGVLRGQELENAVMDADYSKAIQLAFELRRPHRLYELFSELCRKKKAVHQIDMALHVLGREELRLLFEYVREWNTKPKLCHVAQSVLFRLANLLPPTEIIEIKGIIELLEGLLPYSQRHFSRIDRLLRSTYLLDYILAEMSVIEPEADAKGLKVEDESHSDVLNGDEELVAENAEEHRQALKEVDNNPSTTSWKEVVSHSDVKDHDAEHKQASKEMSEKPSATQQKSKLGKSRDGSRRKVESDVDIAGTGEDPAMEEGVEHIQATEKVDDKPCAEQPKRKSRKSRDGSRKKVQSHLDVMEVDESLTKDDVEHIPAFGEMDEKPTAKQRRQKLSTSRDGSGKKDESHLDVVDADEPVIKDAVERIQVAGEVYEKLPAKQRKRKLVKSGDGSRKKSVKIWF